MSLLHCCLVKPPTPVSRTLSLSLSNGGTAGLFWNYVIASVGFGFVYASIAELSSM
jgi:amino acid permease